MRRQLLGFKGRSAQLDNIVVRRCRCAARPAFSVAPPLEFRARYVKLARMRKTRPSGNNVTDSKAHHANPV